MLMSIRLGIKLGVTDNECLSVIEDIIKLYELPNDYYDYKEYI